MKFIDEHKGNKKEISVYGQEYTKTTLKLAKMNLAIRGISANLGGKAASTFQNDQHPDLKADFALMNPPFNQHDWRSENELVDDPRWDGYVTPPVSNANYAWILNMISKLSQNGTGCLLLANGALSADSDEYLIRKQLIENDLIESIIVLPRDMFYSTDISVTIWVFNKNKKERDVYRNGKVVKLRNRENEILFMDLRQQGHPFEKKYIELTKEDREKIVNVFHSWQQVGYELTYKDVKEFCKSVKKSDLKDYSLIPSLYIEFEKKDFVIDFDNEMNKILDELQGCFIEEEETKKVLLDIIGRK